MLFAEDESISIHIFQFLGFAYVPPNDGDEAFENLRKRILHDVIVSCNYFEYTYTIRKDMDHDVTPFYILLYNMHCHVMENQQFGGERALCFINQRRMSFS